MCLFEELYILFITPIRPPVIIAPDISPLVLFPQLPRTVYAISNDQFLEV